MCDPTHNPTGRVAKLMDSRILWESFKNPTDNFLPGMIIDGRLSLTSWISSVDPAAGIYTFKQDDNES